jgi:hypothetical protein
MAKMALGDPRAIKGIVVPLKKIYTFKNKYKTK